MGRVLKAPREAELLDLYFRMKRHRPPSHLGVYIANAEGEWHFVALVDMAWGDHSFRLLGALSRSCRPDKTAWVAVDEPDCFQILADEAQGAPLSFADWRKLYREYAANEARFSETGRFRKFTPAYERLLARTKPGD